SSSHHTLAFLQEHIMPPKKKSPKTAIYFFALEQCGSFRQRSMPIQEIIGQVLPKWKAMTIEQKRPYEERAKQAKREKMLASECQQTSIIPSAEETQFIKLNEDETSWLDQYLQIDLFDLSKKNFLFINFQIFCKTDEEDGGEYIPAELAAMKFSFDKSVKHEFYSFIKRDHIPVGYTSSCFETAEATHQIPYIDFKCASNKYDELWREMEKIIGESVYDSVEPITVFCSAFEREQTKWLLNWLYEKGTNTTIPTTRRLFRVLSFEALVAAILRRLDTMNRINHQSVREMLARPVYTLQIKERCGYHATLAIGHCSRVKNYSFVYLLNDFLHDRLIQCLKNQAQSMAKAATNVQTNPNNIGPTISSSEQVTSSNDDEEGDEDTYGEARNNQQLQNITGYNRHIHNTIKSAASSIISGVTTKSSSAVDSLTSSYLNRDQQSLAVKQRKREKQNQSQTLSASVHLNMVEREQQRNSKQLYSPSPDFGQKPSQTINTTLISRNSLNNNSLSSTLSPSIDSPPHQNNFRTNQHRSATDQSQQEQQQSTSVVKTALLCPSSLAALQDLTRIDNRDSGRGYDHQQEDPYVNRR
ncbi:unnamed protein product, partial [Didymodactylos carnosus]